MDANTLSSSVDSLYHKVDNLHDNLNKKGTLAKDELQELGDIRSDLKLLIADVNSIIRYFNSL